MRIKILKATSLLPFLFYFIFFLAMNAEAQTSPSKIRNVVYSIKIIPAAENTYGYTILNDNVVIIRQTNIPGMPGLKGFRLKADAQKVAALAVSKISRGIMPPTIEKTEMDKLHIHY